MAFAGFLALEKMKFTRALRVSEAGGLAICFYSLEPPYYSYARTCPRILFFPLLQATGNRTLSGFGAYRKGLNWGLQVAV